VDLRFLHNDAQLLLTALKVLGIFIFIFIKMDVNLAKAIVLGLIKWSSLFD
jgi:hypothetical protein